MDKETKTDLVLGDDRYEIVKRWVAKRTKIGNKTIKSQVFKECKVLKTRNFWE
jgi:hypothetical protein